jgi:transcriptional regulator with XRE-family HTH domain
MATTDPTKKTLDPRAKALGLQLDSLRVKRGRSKGDVARAAGVHPTQIGKFLTGKVGLSVEKLVGAARALGAVVVLAESEVASPLILGTINEAGRLMTDLSHLTFPGVIEIRATFGPFKPGDQLHVREASTFLIGKWVIIERPGGERDLVYCDDRRGRRVIVNTSGDALDYEGDRHTVIASVYGRFEQL